MAKVELRGRSQSRSDETSSAAAHQQETRPVERMAGRRILHQVQCLQIQLHQFPGFDLAAGAAVQLAESFDFLLGFRQLTLLLIAQRQRGALDRFFTDGEMIGAILFYKFKQALRPELWMF